MGAQAFLNRSADGAARSASVRSQPTLLEYARSACKYLSSGGFIVVVETDRAKIVRRLEREGWIARHGSKHDLYTSVAKPETSITVPRHRTLSPGVARGIAKDAGWT